MKRILTDIHAHVRASRAHGGAPVAGNVRNTKRYDRFPLMQCQPLSPITTTFSEVLVKRTSRSPQSVTLSFPLLCDIFGHSMSVNGQHRPYPSGGALYPVEAYLFPFDVTGFSKHSHHYRPDLHAFEQMFPIEKTSSSSILTTSAMYPGVIVFTALWARTHGKYHDFALELALMETGHIMQNMQLAATALGVASCPMGGFHDDAIAELLDLDQLRESVLCAIAIGSDYSIHPSS